VIFRALHSTFLVVVIVLSVLVCIWRGIPLENTHQTHFDTLIVLGYPANLDGTLSPDQRVRALEGIQEYKAGVASHIIFTGGPAHNNFVEAHVMALFAESQGVPASAIIEEPQAQNTIQNAYYSVAIMRTNGWRSAEIVTVPYHIPRSALIFAHFPIAFRMQPSSWPREYSYPNRLIRAFREACYADKLRIFGFIPNKFLPI
jgi:uncharacterized SAM-binding protein YcdF (DUF218 family)